MTLGNQERLLEAFRKEGDFYQLNAQVVKPKYIAFACEITNGKKASEKLMLWHIRD